MIEKHLPGDEGVGPDFVADGIVISTRVRLLRNIADLPFVTACSRNQLQRVESTVRRVLAAEPLAHTRIVDAEESDLAERQLLMRFPANSNDSERLARSSEFSPQFDHEAVEQESVCALDTSHVRLLVNDEDHLKIEVVESGLRLDSAWQDADHVDDLLEKRISFSYSSRWGFLTACPANVGTGMRASIVAHLPGLVLTDQIEGVLRGLNRSSLNAREIWGGQQKSDFFRIGNQTTLGLTEQDLLAHLDQAVRSVVDRENLARQELGKKDPIGLRSRVATAFRSFLRANLNDQAEKALDNTARLLSRCRLGVMMGILEPDEVKRVCDRLSVWKLNQELAIAVQDEDYRLASSLRDQIQILEGGSS